MLTNFNVLNLKIIIIYIFFRVDVLILLWNYVNNVFNTVIISLYVLAFDIFDLI